MAKYSHLTAFATPTLVPSPGQSPSSNRSDSPGIAHTFSKQEETEGTARKSYASSAFSVSSASSCSILGEVRGRAGLLPAVLKQEMSSEAPQNEFEKAAREKPRGLLRE